MTDLAMPREHNFTAANVEEWEDRVFLSACESGYFRTYKRLGRGRRVVKEYKWFPEAAMAAYPDPDVLVYAVTKTGRFVCLVRARWQHYLDLWKAKYAPTDKAVRRVKRRLESEAVAKDAPQWEGRQKSADRIGYDRPVNRLAARELKRR